MTDPSGMTYFEPSPEPEEPADAIQESEAATVDAREQAGHGGQVGEGRAGGFTSVGSSQEAREALDWVAAYCADCPYREECKGTACAVYRAEVSAKELLGVPVYAGVPMRQDIT